MKKILVIGEVTVDFVAKVKKIPKGNEEIVMDDMFARIAGLGWNIANTFETLKVPYDLLAMIGSGENGESIKKTAEKMQLKLNTFSDEIHGCTETMIDATGNTTGMVVPGCEYDFPFEEAEELFSINDYSAIIFSNLEMPNNHLEELFDILSQFDGNIYYVISEHGSVNEEWLKNALFAVNPIIIGKTKEILALADNASDDIVSAASLLSLKTSKPVIIENGDQALSVNAYEVTSYENKDNVICIDDSGSLDSFAGAYVDAREIGINENSALEFAKKCSLYILQTYETILPESKKLEVQETLSNIILNKK